MASNPRDSDLISRIGIVSTPENPRWHEAVVQVRSVVNGDLLVTDGTDETVVPTDSLLLLEDYGKNSNLSQARERYESVRGQPIDSVFLVVYVGVRVPLEGAPATTPHEALERALQSVDLDRRLTSTVSGCGATHHQYMEWIAGMQASYLADEDELCDDENYWLP